MTRTSIILCTFFALTFSLWAQEITQAVSGRITDQTTGSPLSNASVRIARDQVIVQSTQTDNDGRFSITLPVGRYKLSVSYTGFSGITRELLVISGKESTVSVSLQSTTQQLQEVEVRSSAETTDIPGLRSLSIEKTLRIPANFFDPVRAATAYPGVVTANDQNNAIIIRGNSPNGLLWRLNGLDIVNPNHLAYAGTLSDVPAANGGGVNILSAQMLDRTDFYTGSFPASYGNALSGIVDMRLREGNKSRWEYTAQASLIGMDLSAEGPLNKSKSTSLLVNYRYSTVGLLSLAGVNFGDEAITFQDLSFNLNTDLKNNGKLTFFGFWGDSKNDFDVKPADEWEEDKDKYDITYGAQTAGAGVNFSIPAGRGKFSAGVAYSSSDQGRDAMLSQEASPFDRTLLFEQYQLDKAIASASLRFKTPLTDKINWDVGLMANYLVDDLFSFRAVGCPGCATRTEREVAGNTEGVLLQPFTNFRITFSPEIVFDGGVRYLHYEFNNTSSIEPRANLKWIPTRESSFDLSYSLVSQLQLPIVYLTKDNEDLEMTKSSHLDLSYSRSISDDFSLRSGIFYQYLFHVPIINDPFSTFTTLNLMEGQPAVSLTNIGAGENYGVDVTLDKQFFGNHYFLLGGSYYQSKYKAGDGKKRDTRFNGNYTFSGVYGKEWTKTSKKRTIGLNTRVLYLGGLRRTPVDVDASINQGETVYRTSDTFVLIDPYPEKLDDYFRLDLRLSFRKDKTRYTRTFAIDIQNLTSQQNEAYQYYDFTQSKVVTKYQLGIIPVLVYRIDF
jgi:hypothetical protein